MYYPDKIADCNEDMEYGEIIDCTGKFIMPGLIDIHSDVVENIIVPRKGIIFSNYTALSEVDKELASQGITTMYHSISIANSTICNRKRTLSVKQMIAIVSSVTIFPFINVIYLEFIIIPLYSCLCMIDIVKILIISFLMDNT